MVLVSVSFVLSGLHETELSASYVAKRRVLVQIQLHVRLVLGYAEVESSLVDCTVSARIGIATLFFKG